MKSIRTKIILIFLGVVLLPLLPTIWLVNDLVHQSYQVGVNPQVEKALKQGVEFSRQLYNIRKIQLSDKLSKLELPDQFAQDAEGTSLSQLNEMLLENKQSWRFLSIQFYDAAGQLLSERKFGKNNSKILSDHHFKQIEKSPGEKMIFANRKENRFFAVEKRKIDKTSGYLALLAAMDEQFLEKTDNNLEVYQLYRSLSLSPISIPKSFFYTFLLISIIVLLITIALAIWISQRITHPLGELVKGTEEIGKGNLDYHIHQQSRDEVGELVRQFNRMTGELKAYQEKTIYLEKMAAWQEIARRLAHEIKNPLTPIQLTAQEMVDQYQTEDEYANLLKECNQIINEEVENLRRLVSEFSEFGRLPELNLQLRDIQSLIHEVQNLYPHRDIQLNMENELPQVEFDADRVRRVLINLIENAIEADPNNQPLVIQVRHTNAELEISVKDRGKGIPHEVQNEIFQPYYTSKSNGMGLGLAITRKMVEEHGGKIRVTSTSGEGSIFTFTLPTPGKLDDC